MTEEPTTIDARVDTKNLYREETYTDLKVATIRRLVPVKLDGSRDDAREALFTGHTQILSPAGPLPVQCRIPARDLKEAIAKFPDAIGKAVDQMIEEVKELQRREAGRIVVPGAETRSKLHLP